MTCIPKLPIFISALILITFVICSSATDYRDCGSVKGKVTSVTVTGCPSGPCKLVRGKSTNLTISFKMYEAAKDVKAVAFGVIGGVKVPFNPPHPDACVESGLKCPLSNGKAYKYISEIPVKKFYPKVSLLVMWFLKDEKAETIVCIGMQVQIVDN